MSAANGKQNIQFWEVRKNLPRSPSLLPDVSWLKRIAEAILDQGAGYQWLDLPTVHQVCLDADLHDAQGPIELKQLQTLFAVLFRRQSQIFFDLYEIESSARGTTSEPGPFAAEPEYRFQRNDENFESYRKYLEQQITEQEQLADGAEPAQSKLSAENTGRGQATVCGFRVGAEHSADADRHGP